MRALRSERLMKSGSGRKGKAARAPTRRRKPPPRWRRPALMGVAVATLGALVLGGGYALWRAGYPERALAWAGGTLERAQIAAGLSVQEVILWGRQRTPREEVLSALDVRRGEPVFNVGLDAVRARLEAVGWIASATVARRLPATLEVRIVERTPLAMWQHERQLVLISRDGVPITTEKLERYRQLPLVVGKDAPLHAARLFAVLGREPALFQRVEAAVRVSGRRWNVRFQGGIEVRLPEGGMREAWERLAALEREHQILSRRLVAIDLRLPDRLVVQLKPGSARRFRDPGEKT